MTPNSLGRFSARTIPWTSIAVAMFLACTSPTESCGCSPAELTALVVGEVIDPAGTAVAGATIHAELATPGCVTTKGNLGTGVSDAAGQYRVDLRTFGAATIGDCLQIRAEPPSGTPLLSSIAVPFAVGFSFPPPVDTVVINLTLRSPE